MGSTYTRQSTFTDGDTITADLFNTEFDQLVAAFAATSGHSHDGTAGEGGPIGGLITPGITLGDNTIDVTLTFDGGSNDGVLKWMEDEDYFEFSDDILIASTEKLQFRDTAIYINSSADGQLDIVADTEIQIAATTIDINGAVALNGAITGATNITLSGELDAATLDISGNADIDGNLDVGGNLTVTGTTTFNGGTLTLGDAATDNVVFGADVNSSIIPNTDDTYDLGSSGQEWRDLYLDGTAHIDTLDVDANATVAGTLGVTGIATVGGLTIGSAVISEAELEILDGASVTTDELNILDGKAFLDEDNFASNSATGIASQQSIKAYVDGVTTTSITSTGALNAGSITSGFGNIDTGASTITTTGLISGGSLDIDNVLINGTTIGHTDDTDLITLADGVVTVAGEVSMTTLDIGGTNVTSTAAELNALDGITAVVGELNALDLGSTAVGTAIASKAVVLDSNKDYTGIRNFTITGNLSVGGTTTVVDTVTMNAQNAVLFEGATADAHETTLTIVDPTADRTINLPNQSGTIPVLAAASNTAVTSTPEELNILDGVTATAAELNILDVDNSTLGNLAEISTVANDDVFLAIDTSGGGLKRLTRSTVVSGLATSSGLSNVVEDTSPQLGGNLDTNSQNILIDDAHFIGDESGNEQLVFQTTGSAVNQLEITNAATGNGPILASTGGDTNINLNLTPKGTGVVMIDGTVGIDTGKIDLKNSGTASQILFYCESSNAHAQTLQGAPHSQAATNTLLLPDGDSGTLLSTVSTATVTNKTFTSPKINEDVAVTSTATEINLLDGVTATTAELNILAGVTATTAEINLIDGGTARGTTAVADGDGVLINDAGTMRMTSVDTLSTYMSGKSVGGSSIVTTGALNSGSITSGFGTIDTGSSAITTTGVITGGTLEATTDTAAGDNAAIGYTAAEGLILTGQGSTSDITLKNDADAVVFTVPTGSDDIQFPDNAGIKFGAGADLHIYHSGTNSVISDGGTGNLLIKADELLIQNSAGDANYIRCVSSDESVQLSFANSTKLSTTNTGVDVTGAITADGLTVDDVVIDGKAMTMTGSSSDTAVFTVGTNGTLSIVTTDDAAAAANIQITADGTAELAGTTVTLDSGGDIDLAATNDVNLPANVGLTFGNDGEKIEGDGTNLAINSSGDLNVTATTIDIDGNVEISGTAVTTGVHTFTAVPVFPNDTVETADIQADAITGAKIADNAINSEHYTDGSIDTAHIADSQITVAKMAANSVDSDQYVDGSIDREHLAADIIDGTKIANDAINSEHYAAGSIDNEHIADNAINSEHYADGSIDRAHLAADIIDGTKIADDVINSEHYVAGSIDAEHLASDSVTEAKMAANSVDSQAYVDGSIDTAHIADNQITLAKMAGIARGKLIVGDSGGNPAVIGPGSNGQVLTSDGTDIAFADAAGGPTYTRGTSPPSSPTAGDWWLNTNASNISVFIYDGTLGWVSPVDALTAGPYLAQNTFSIIFGNGTYNIIRIVDDAFSPSYTSTVGTHTSNGGDGAVTSNTVRAVVHSGTDESTDMEFVVFANLAAATTFGTGIDLGDRQGAISHATRGIFVGGNDHKNNMEYITIASEGNSTDFGNLTVDKSNLNNSCLASTTRGVIWSGTNNLRTIDYCTILTAGNATDFGDTTVNASFVCTAHSTTRGIRMGSLSTATDTIEYITIASTGNATDFGNLSASGANMYVVHDGTYAWMKRSTDVGGERITMATTGNAVTGNYDIWEQSSSPNPSAAYNHCTAKGWIAASG